MMTVEPAVRRTPCCARRMHAALVGAYVSGNARRFRRRAGLVDTSRPPRRTVPAPDRGPGRPNCSIAARSAASTSTWRPSRSASTALLKDKTPQVTRSPIDQSPAARLTFHDREHLSTTVNTAPRRAQKCSRSNGNLFTLPWNPRSRSRGNTVHHRVEYAIKNEPKWIKDCTKIRARASELVDGKISLIEAALALEKLAIWTHAQSDPDLSLFKRIIDDLSGLPIGSERSHWAAHALAREDVKIKAVVDKWQHRGLNAASRLVNRYAWSLEARAGLRSAGHHDSDSPR
jgi:hypothetical protein